MERPSLSVVNRVLHLAAMFAFLAAACSPTSTTMPPADGLAGPGVDGLTSDLAAEGVEVSVSESPYSGHEGTVSDNWLVCLNGHEVLVYEFTSESDRVDQVGEGALPDSEYDDLFWGKNAWWATGNILVWMHVDTDYGEVESRLLDTVLGEGVATNGHSLGSQPEELLPSEICP